MAKLRMGRGFRPLFGLYDRCERGRFELSIPLRPLLQRGSGVRTASGNAEYVR